MYIRTPKRYRGMQRRQMFSCQRLFMILILVVLIVLGIGIYEMRDMVGPRMMDVVNTGADQVNNWQSTQFAPTAEPTRDPSSVVIDGDNNWSSGRIRFALNSYNEAVVALPNNVPVHIRLAEGYLTRGDIANALHYADDTVTANPFSPDAWATRALVYSWEDNFAEGIASAQQALALDPNNVRGTAYLAYAYLQAGQFNLAISRADDAIALNPDHWSGYWVRGLISENAIVDIASAQVDYEIAYNLALEQNPAMAGVVVAGLARTYIAFQNAPRSVELLNEFLAIDDSNREVLYWLGVTHYTYLGEWGQAQDPFSDCVDVAPSDYRCWYMLGRTRNSLGDQEGALVAFEEAIDNNTPFARHYWWAANTERNLGSCAGATSYLEIGYSMVIEGELPADDEGNLDLISNFESELATCRITVLPNDPIEPATPEATAETEEQ